jgi:hypothetical protein
MIELSAAEQPALVRDGRVSARDLVTSAYCWPGLSARRRGC